GDHQREGSPRGHRAPLARAPSQRRAGRKLRRGQAGGASRPPARGAADLPRAAPVRNRPAALSKPGEASCLDLRRAKHLWRSVRWPLTCNGASHPGEVLMRAALALVILMAATSTALAQEPRAAAVLMVEDGGYPGSDTTERMGVALY